MDDIPDNSEYFIKINGPVETNSYKDLKLKGKFKVPYDNGVMTKGSQVLKHIIMVVSRSGNYQSLAPFKDMAVFLDDVEDEGDCCKGYFNITVSDYIGFDGKGEYYILCSLGNYLSNIINVKVA